MMQIKLYRKLFDGAFIEHRSTYLSDVDQLAAIQLSIILLQKPLGTKDMLSPPELFSLQKRISQRKYKQKEFVSNKTFSPGLPEAISFEDVFEAYTDFTKQCNMLDKTDVCIFVKNAKQNVDSHSTDPRLGKVLSIDLNEETSKDMSPLRQSPANPAQLQLQRIILGYFQLIVNTRDEIALARVIDVPTRGIDHTSFTDIRKLSHMKGMPMYQIVSSFVRQISLAGKGYAPGENHVLFQHKTGLQEFIELMDKLQTVVDESDNIAVALQRMLKILKMAFIRAKVPVFKSNMVSMVINDLFGKIKKCFTQDHGSQEIVLELRDFLDYMSSVTGNGIGVNSSQLCGVLSTPRECNMIFKKMSSLTTQFRTPELTDETPKKSKVLEENTSPCNVHTERVVLIDTPKTLEDTHVKTEDDIQLIRCHGILTAKEKVDVDISKENKVADKKNKAKKRKMDEQIRTKKPTASSNKVSKKLRLLPGQRTLAHFFS